MKTYFVTGTDTDAGKTLITQALLLKAQQQGLSCYGLKPVAAGAVLHQGQLKNDDALSLQRASSVALNYSSINPIVFEPAIAPHIVAEKLGQRLDINSLAKQIESTLNTYAAERVFVEGAGGWLVPINDDNYLSDLAARLNLEVIVVVGLKLGCLNHALLTVKAIEQQGLKVAAWVATQLDDTMLMRDENMATLKRKINAPCLGVVTYQQGIQAEQVAESIQLPA